MIHFIRNFVICGFFINSTLMFQAESIYNDEDPEAAAAEELEK